MGGTIEFYFDFMSPLRLSRPRAARRNREEARSSNRLSADRALARQARRGATMVPSNQKIPSKLKYMIADLSRWGDTLRHPLQSDH